MLQHHLALEEDTLRSAAVDLLGLADHNGVIFEVVENDQLADLVVLKTALNDALLEVAVESQNLYNK